MKKLAIILGFGIALSITSCSQMQGLMNTPNSEVAKGDAPKFTTVDKVLKINEGMSYQEVVATLGCEPYDIYSLNDKENKTVYIWHYKKIKRNENPDVMKKREGAVTGSEVICCEEVAYLTFDNRKLVSLVTDAGKGVQKRADENVENTTAPKVEEKKGIFKLF